MKKLFFFVAVAMVSFAAAQRPFIGKWDVYDNNIKFRVLGSGSYTWERISGSTTEPETGSGTFTSGLVNINVPTSFTTYKVSITPTNSFRFIYENSGLSTNDINEFSEITQWGDVNWSPALTNMFYNVNGLRITANDVPNFSNVTDMSGLFKGCANITTIPRISQWNVSQVTNMASMFSGAYSFNDDISNWNTSNVTDMANMFTSCSWFNQPIGSWDVSKVTNMSGMFYGSNSFNQPLNNWNVSNVTDMNRMFQNATEFNQPIGIWNTTKVTNMRNMFRNANAFNQSINSWNVGNVTNMGFMFYNATKFNQPLDAWNVSKVIDMGNMFYNANEFNKPLNDWNVSNVTLMSEMFYNASKFNQTLDKWNVSNVSGFSDMFYNASAFNQNLGMWKLGGLLPSYYNLSLGGMLNNSGLDCTNYGKTLQGWSSLAISNYIKPNLGAQNLTYGPAAVQYRNMLIASGWNITGDYLDPDCDATLGLNDTKNKIALQMFPNPTADYFKMNSLQADMLSLYDMSGKLMKTQKLTVGQNTVDISSFPKGVYIAKTANASAKIIKK